MKDLCSSHWESIPERARLADSHRRASGGLALRLMTKKYGEALQGRAHEEESVEAPKSSFEVCVALLVHR